MAESGSSSNHIRNNSHKHHTESQFGKIDAAVETYSKGYLQDGFKWKRGTWLHNYDHIIERRQPRQAFGFMNGKRTLVRQEEERVADFNSLFLDLVFVGAFSASANGIERSLSGNGSYMTAFLQFFASFSLVHQLWCDISFLENVYYPRDLLHKFYLGIMMAATSSMISLGLFVENRLLTIGIYMAVEVIHFLFQLYNRQYNPFNVHAFYSSEIAFIVTFPIFITAAVLDKYWTGASENLCLVLVIVGFIVSEIVRHYARIHYTKRALKYKYGVVALNIEHLADRSGAFILLLFGEIILSLKFSAKEFTFHHVVGSILILLTAFALQTIFFDVECGRSAGHPFRLGGIQASLWIRLHMLLGAAILIMGCGSREILHEIDNFDINDAAINLYTYGLSAMLVCLALMSSLHKHYSDYRIHKGRRNIIKIAVAIIIVTVPRIISLNFSHLWYVGFNTVIVSGVAMVDFHGNQQIVPPDTGDINAPLLEVTEEQ